MDSETTFVIAIAVRITNIVSEVLVYLIDANRISSINCHGVDNSWVDRACSAHIGVRDLEGWAFNSSVQIWIGSLLGYDSDCMSTLPAHVRDASLQVRTRWNIVVHIKLTNVH